VEGDIWALHRCSPPAQIGGGTGNPSPTEGKGWGPGTEALPSGKCDGSARNQYTEKDDLFVRIEKRHQVPGTSGKLVTRSMSLISRTQFERRLVDHMYKEHAHGLTFANIDEHMPAGEPAGILFT
jgi:hypothetical protein